MDLCGRCAALMADTYDLRKSGRGRGQQSDLRQLWAAKVWQDL